MTDALVPGAVPVGWIAIVRPDRVVLNDGPVGQQDSMVSASLGLLLQRAPAAVLQASRDEPVPPLAA
jgi:3-(3-hydroxy-phenyl)propionate hydroxylase